MKKRMAVFRVEGRSPKWRRIDQAIKNSLEIRKSKYFETECEKLRTMGRSHQWYAVLSKMLDDDSPKPWFIGDIDPDLSHEQLAERLATHLSLIHI